MNPTSSPVPRSDVDFDARLQQALDERHDPLDDPQLVAWLDAHPERLAAFVALRDDLRVLAAAPSPVARFTRRACRRLVAALAVATAAVWLVAFARREPQSPATAVSRSPGRILTARLDSHVPRRFAAADFAVRESLSVANGQRMPGLAQGTTLLLEAYRLHHLAR